MRKEHHIVCINIFTAVKCCETAYNRTAGLNSGEIAKSVAPA